MSEMDADHFERLKAEAHRLAGELIEAREVSRLAGIATEAARESALAAQRAVRDYAEEVAGFDLAYLGGD